MALIPIPRVEVFCEDDPITPTTRYYWCQITGFMGETHNTSGLGRVIHIENRVSPEVNPQAGCALALWEFCRSGCMPGILITHEGYEFVPDPPAFTSEDIHYDLPRFKPSDLAEIHTIPSPDGGYHRNVKRVRLKSNTSETMILKTLSPSSEPNDLVFELKRLQQLHQCACTPNLLGVFGDPLGNAYRGLLIRDLGGKSVFELLCENPGLPLSYKRSLAIALVRAMREIEDTGCMYLQDVTCHNLVVTSDGRLFVVDLGPGRTVGFYDPNRTYFDFNPDFNADFAAALYGVRKVIDFIVCGPKVFDPDNLITSLGQYPHQLVPCFEREYGDFGQFLNDLLIMENWE
jgi:hypothetical protein